MVQRQQRTQSSSSPKKRDGSIRIISGLWRGRKLPVHNTEGLRPTTDRIKETVFNWLSKDILQSHCLDVFAGSGGLGFEALSRGADKVTMIELDKNAYQQLITNKITLKSEKVEIIHDNALNFLQKPGQPYDLVFIDPPFRKGLLDDTIKQLEDNQWLAKGALIYIETEKEMSHIDTPANWKLHREKTAGQVSYRLYQREAK
ncbi:MAG: 16S rRNA (guanine(966)-N(2))-methyltransferase RsmD [Aliivibrio sp.]|uniref:16S rRNA (guanine(966)-N(2))-methyltransferase RsmD n=1 Tax=Aliivibrio sp. TaxID=1872443 RepID=UPI001A41603A|nr:16S rRNA (guanine(966)-N(2))-methyltransferase RsmD [Aliivibrio sp.]